MTMTTTDPVTTTAAITPHCDMRRDCEVPVTMLEDTGWVYCTEHGLDRRWHGERIRRLRPYELRRLQRGEQITRY